MAKQKVITVNINTSKTIGNTGFNEFELVKINKYLDEGYVIIDKISSIPPATSAHINLTFILALQGK